MTSDLVEFSYGIEFLKGRL